MTDFCASHVAYKLVTQASQTGQNPSDGFQQCRQEIRRDQNERARGRPREGGGREREKKAKGGCEVDNVQSGDEKRRGKSSVGPQQQQQQCWKMSQSSR